MAKASMSVISYSGNVQYIGVNYAGEFIGTGKILMSVLLLEV